MSKKDKDKGFLVRFDRADHGPEHFEIVWDGFRAVFPKHAKGYEKLKLCNRVGAKLEEVSLPSSDYEQTGKRELKFGDQKVLFLADEFNRLKQMVEDDDIGWPQRKGTQVQAAVEFVRGQKEIEVETETTPVEEK